VALDGHQSTAAHTTNNQQQAVMEEARTERRCDEQEECEKHNTIFLVGVESKQDKNPK
jgi:hypothetical protein